MRQRRIDLCQENHSEIQGEIGGGVDKHAASRGFLATSLPSCIYLYLSCCPLCFVLSVISPTVYKRICYATDFSVVLPIPADIDTLLRY